jgi:type IV pilus assembly protein PilQ
MKKALSAILFLALMGCMHSAVFAAELLDVKPVVAGTAVSVEISADIAMTYTYYKVPGQARAVVDIAEADPEKVEPLIVVNKGAVSSISVDKAQISGLVVSRIIFNLTSEADISVTASPDRKLLTVTFGGSTAAAGKPEPKPEPKPVQPPEPVAKIEPPVAAVVTPPVDAPKEEDPLGLDEPAAAPAAAVAKAAPAVAAVAAVAAAEVPLPAAAPTIMRIPKLEPVVPVAVAAARPSSLSIKEISTGASYIEIRANQPVTDYKTSRISGPDRLVIDIPSEKVNQKAKTVTINKFGISKARIGVSPKNIRIVIDSAKAKFPEYTITHSEDGLRISFK